MIEVLRKHREGGAGGRRVDDSLGAEKRVDTPPLLWGMPDQLSIKANS